MLVGMNPLFDRVLSGSSYLVDKILFATETKVMKLAIQSTGKEKSDIL